MESAQTCSEPSSSFTFAHLSDPHLTTVDAVTWGEMLNKRALGYLAIRRRRHAKSSPAILEQLRQDLLTRRPDHIAVTGDLTNLGTPVEYEEAAGWLESLGAPGTVSVVPGNHDCYAPDKRVSPADRWGAWMRSDELTGGDFPFVHYRGPVAFIGVSSAVPKLVGLATGTVGHQQRQRLAAALDQAKAGGYLRVVLIHHPPQADAISKRKCLTDGACVRQVLSQHGAELVLHGHAHRFMHGSIATPGGPIPVLGAPGAGATATADGECAGYYRLRLDCFDRAFRLVVGAYALAPRGGELGRVTAYGAELEGWLPHAGVAA